MSVVDIFIVGAKIYIKFHDSQTETNLILSSAVTLAVPLNVVVRLVKCSLCFSLGCWDSIALTHPVGHERPRRIVQLKLLTKSKIENVWLYSKRGRISIDERWASVAVCLVPPPLQFSYLV